MFSPFPFRAFPLGVLGTGVHNASRVFASVAFPLYSRFQEHGGATKP
ncbi:MAG: hypothetical protein QFX34_04750 [Candidatus Verstraetearchaeota archaeon]|nr:hypothetical protein [Candidatus Verstraetearchaeota archaeon]